MPRRRGQARRPARACVHASLCRAVRLPRARRRVIVCLNIRPAAQPVANRKTPHDSIAAPWLPYAQAHERAVVAAKGPEAVLPAALAEFQGDESDTGAGQATDTQIALSPGCSRRDRPDQPCAARLRSVLRYGQRGEPLHRCGRLRAPATQEPAGQTRGGRNQKAVRAQHLDREYFEGFGLHRLRGTTRYPGKPPGDRRAA